MKKEVILDDNQKMNTMKYILIILSIIFIAENTHAQDDYAAAWKKELLAQPFDVANINEIKNIDLSNIISNCLLEKESSFSSYVGIFGPKYRRIDFRLHAQKSKTSDYKYIITGKSRLGNNIRELNGTMTLTNLKRDLIENKSLYLCIFNYQLNEPGDRDGDGSFEGVASVLFYTTNNNNKPKLYWSACGEYRDWNNTFVGTWKRFNSNVTRKCIFNFRPAGLYDKLPFCDGLYIYSEDIEEPEDLTRIDPYYFKYGWKDYDTDSETKWW